MTVHLLGVGPGDPELLTLRAARLLGRAEAVVHDRLIGPDVLGYASPTAERYDVGKTPGHPGPTQRDINELLVQLGARLDCVVRVKGGDPTVFGRGAEEVEACHRAGIRTEVVPGITSSIAGPTAAGVSLTRRGTASGFCVVTAHHDPRADPGNWSALAHSGLTIVVLMGARGAPRVADALLGAGMQADTPVAVVTSATLPEQQTCRTALGDLGTTPLRAPSVIVIGDVAAAEASLLAEEVLSGDPQGPGTPGVAGVAQPGVGCTGTRHLAIPHVAGTPPG